MKTSSSWLASWLGRSKLAKAAVLLFAIFFTLTPILPAFAQEKQTPVVVEQPISEPQAAPAEPAGDLPTEGTPTEGGPVEEAPADPKVEEPKEENPEEKPKEEEPEPESLMVAGPINQIDDVAPRDNRLTPEVDNITGALVYRYNIVVPPGRNKMTPDISLVYSSANAVDDSVIGSGWSVNIPTIERINRKGTNNLYSQNYFASSMDGELISTGTGTYGAKDENGNFLNYSLSNNVWTVTDKEGTVYKFGTNAAERQDNSSDTIKVFKWMLQEVRDTNDNYIEYEYYKDAGQIYPSKVTYTGNGSTDGVLEVNFNLVSRSNAPTFYDNGFSVKSNYRISEIRTEVNNVWARKYTLAYTTGDNTLGSFLNTITESGQDDSSNVITLPAADFNYNAAATDWTNNSSIVLPLPFTDTGSEYGMRTADINGDGLLDILCHNNSNSYACQRTTPMFYLNNGNGGWTDVSSTWSFPTMVDDSSNTEAFLNSSLLDTGLRVIDVNGDLKADLVRGNENKKYVYLNNGTNGWTYNSSWVLPVPFVDGGTDSGMRMGDINGDGLPDILCHYDKTSGPCNKNNPQIHLHNGTGWTDVSNTWLFPIKVDNMNEREGFLSNILQDNGMRLVDVNGDGLSDLVRGKSNDRFTYINNGSGWTYTSSWNLPYPFIGSSGQDVGVRMADINGDGLPDLLCHDYSTSSPYCPRSTPRVMINDGFDWNYETTAWEFPAMVDNPTQKEAFNNASTDRNVRMLDINGDGIDDMVRAYSSSIKYSYLNNEDVQANLLTEIVHPQGGNTIVTYKATPLFRDGSNNILNPKVPVVSDVVYQVSNSDGLGLTATSTYEYEGGEYYYNTALDRKFSGFNKITKTNAAGNKSINYFHQGNTTDSSNGEYSDHVSKIGKVYRTEIKDSSSNVYGKVVNKWDKYQIATDRNFVKLIQSIGFNYDGDSDHKDKAAAYTYSDTTGNVTEVIDWGEVTGADAGTFTDTGSDKFTTSYSYASGGSIIGLSSQETTVDQSSVKVRESKSYYDGQTLGNVTDGNLTKQEIWKDGSNYIDVEKTYNTTYGIVTQDKDPRDKATNYSYDSYNLYPATVTNPLSQVTSYTYDYSSGQVKQVTDPNIRVFQTTYDALDRVKEVKQPDLATPSTLVTKTDYAYTDTSGSVKVQKTDYLDGSVSVESHAYFDGLNRPIQARTEMEDSNTFAVTDIVYNNNGQMHKESLPYSSTGSSKTSATTNANLLTTYSYDPMMRVTTAVNAIGTITNAYDDWKHSITDPRGKTKHYYKDSRGNLIKVEEINSGSTYTTNYEYNGNNKLTKITDALSNVRNFTYDGIGRRLTAQDLHASADATFGTWTYTYDASSNLTSVVDPKSQTINYTYDDVNRQLTEDYTGQGGTEATYAYDSGTDGIGRLISVTATGANSTYSYDANGNLKQEVKNINSTNYQTDYTYGRQGNNLEITNPDSSKVKYAYNTAGQLETVQRKESTDGSFINLATDFDYGPHGKLTYQAFQNGSATTNTYDATKLYRLSNKTTTITGGSKVQDLTYTYDNNSNVTRIVDASNTSSSKTVDYIYDDLNRLLSATATNVASGQSTYTHSYTYNAIGNILTRTDAAGTYTYAGDQGASYANSHAVTSVGAVNYTYDNNGNMLTETSGLSNTWDYNNRLSQAVKGAVTSNYTYDHAGQRVKLANGTTTTYYPSKGYNTDGTTAVKHIYAGDMMLATVKGTGASAAVYSDHTDHLTGSNVITNSSGTQEELMDYFPYGNIRLDQKAGSFDEQRKFTGHEFDADTGLSYMQARYYNSGIGRFVSQDAVHLSLGNQNQVKSLTGLDQDFILSDPQSFNSYSYARNNPLIYIDRDGNLPALVQLILIGLFAPKVAQAPDNDPNTNELADAQLPSELDALSMLIGGTKGGNAKIPRSKTLIGPPAPHSKGVPYGPPAPKVGPGNWRDANTLQKHFGDHGPDFRAADPTDYAHKAQGFRLDAESKGFLKKVDSNGDQLIYDPGSNTFGVYDAQGRTRTFYKPTEGKPYFDRQRGTLVNPKK